MYEIYMIEDGDTLDIIATKTGTSVDNLREINKKINIMPGEYIIVPASNNDYFEMYTVEQGDNMYKIALEFGVDVNTLMLLNGLNKDDYIYPNQQLIVPKGMVDIYITKQGDTFDTLVNGLNTDYENIIDQNRKIMLVPDQLVVIRRTGMQKD